MLANTHHSVNGKIWKISIITKNTHVIIIVLQISIFLYSFGKKSVFPVLNAMINESAPATSDLKNMNSKAVTPL
jgi:hypothetical protein